MLRVPTRDRIGGFSLVEDCRVAAMLGLVLCHRRQRLHPLAVKVMLAKLES
jgi:hypothetical protein